MAKRKAAKKPATRRKAKSSDVEPMVIALAEQLGSFLGRVQKKADGLLDKAALRRQASQIRDGATQLLNQVNRTSVAVRKLAAPKRHGREGESVAKPAVKKSKAKSHASATKGRSGGAVDAQGKRHRKPPPQELFDPRLGEPMGKQMGQKSFKPRSRG
jgi:hypothetical protein